MKALVIGGTGPTGPHIVNGLLARNYEVTILHRGAHEVEFSEPVEHLHGDPHFLETLQEILGARSFALVISTYGRLRMVAEAMKERTPRFIGIGGTRAYKALVRPQRGPVGIPIPIAEDAPRNLDPELDKFTYLMAVAEQAVMKMHDEGHYRATIIRYPLIYGPRQTGPSEWSIMRRILDGRKQLILPDAGLTLRSMGYAENMAYAVMLVVDKSEQSAGQIYNVADEKVISVRERIELVSQVMNHEWEFINVPGEPAVPSRPYTAAGFHTVLDITKIKNELGYQDLVPVEEAIRRTVNWYLDNRPEPGGQEERNVRDTFDYDAEDRFIEEFKATAARIREIPIVREPRHHTYAHPKTAGEMRDHRGR